MKLIAILVFCLAVAKALPSSGPRIIGGVEGDIKNFNSLVSITYKDEHFCGGFIYNERFVATTAYCAQKHPDELLDLNVYAGQINLILADTHEQRRGVRQIYVNEGYKNETKINDIALLELTSPFNVTQFEEIGVGIFDEVDADGDTLLEFAGWGAVQISGLPSVMLQKTKLELFVNGSACQVYGDSDFQTNTMICAGPTKYNVNETDPGSAIVPEGYPCDYDEGSPLFQEVYDSAGNPFTAVVGIMSKNKGCDADNRKLPTVFTRLSAYYAWLFRIAGSQPPPPTTTTPEPCKPGTPGCPQNEI